jgi:hypothetical protein
MLYPGTGHGDLPAQQTPATVRARRILLAAGCLVVALVIAIAVVVWHPWRHQISPTDAAVAAHSGPRTGVYSAEFGPEVELGSGKELNADGLRGTLKIRSACTPTGCMAIANAVDGPTINRSLIFDDVAGQWISVATAPSASPQISKGLNAGCEQGLSPEVWETVSLQSQPNGTFTGRYEVTDANNCNTSRTINLTRKGDLDLSTVDDPSVLPALKPSAAAGFRGQYRYQYRSEGDDDPHEVVGSVQTRCLRTVERCMSYFSEPRSAEPFVFADGQWILRYHAPVSCGSAAGPRVTIDRTATLDLPSPASDPIDLLAGRGHEEIASDQCTVNNDFDLRFERISD